MRCKALRNVLFYCREMACAESSRPINPEKVVYTRMEHTDSFYVRSDKIYMEDGCRSGLLRIRYGRVDALLSAEQIPDGPVVDARGARVIPGIIDTHNHGTCGWSLERPRGFDQDVETVCRYVKACASQGITSVFPTAVPAMISACAQAAALHPVGAEICGIHSEGPWLARSGEGGAARPCAPADMDTAYSLWEDAHGLLRLVSLAPETPGVWPVIDFFLSHGVTVGAAHSNNRYAAAMAAYDRGISVSTHTGNVMTGIHHRDIGGLGAALTHPDVECEVICDGQHVCPEMLRLYFMIKDPSRFLIISDSTAFCGTPAGRYTMPNGETRHVTSDGQILTSGGRRCGSARPALFGIRTLTEKLDMPFETALRMATIQPARKYGLSARKGSLAPGKDADFVVLGDDYQVLATYVAGKRVYDRSESSLLRGEFFTERLFTPA